ncbi:hypothetical protein UP17_09080 [Peribacillus simplex]|nr:hypothetical protein UP17_09080 [Peribacillus simplex]
MISSQEINKSLKSFRKLLISLISLFCGRFFLLMHEYITFKVFTKKGDGFFVRDLSVNIKKEMYFYRNNAIFI